MKCFLTLLVSVFYFVCPPCASLSHLWFSWLRLQVLQELWAFCCFNTKHILITWLIRSTFFAQYLLVNSFVDSALLFFPSFSLIFSSNLVSTMRCLVCLWWAFQHSRLCFIIASISSMLPSLHGIVIKAGTRSTYRLLLIPSVAQIPKG